MHVIEKRFCIVFMLKVYIMNYHIGTKVEICCDEDGFQGAWFPGTIIGHVANAQRPKYVIQYDHFIIDELTWEPLIEEFFIEYIRPTPPLLSLPGYIPLDFVVDVYENDCWWSGMVFEKFESPLSQQQFFEIYFPHTQTLQAYSQAHLCRSHDWVNRRWILRQCY